MDTLALKLVLTPLLILLVSLAGRRWGSGISGLLIGLPLTSGPVCAFLVLEQGAAFGGQAAVGALAGIVAVAGGCVGYGIAARRGLRWPSCLATGGASFGVLAIAVHQLSAPPAAMFLVAVLAVCAAAAVLRDAGGLVWRQARQRDGWRDAGVRAVLATATVLILTAVADRLGPQTSGLLAPFPVYTSVLVVFSHREEGSAAARRLLRGQMLGSVSFAVFFLIVAAWIDTHGAGVAFGLAAVGSLLSHAIIYALFFGRGPTARALTRTRDDSHVEPGPPAISMTPPW